MTAVAEVTVPPIFDVTPELGYARIFWMAGVDPNRNPRFRSEVKDPPCNGWMGVFVLDKGGKTVTLFCPFTFVAFNVTKQSAEYNSLVNQGYNDAWMRKHLPKAWAEMVERSWSRDYDVAAAVMRQLGLEVPLSAIKVGDDGEEKTRGGKEVEAKMTKPVKKNGRRGQVLAFFLATGGRRSILEAMAEIGVTRKNLLSQMFLLQKDHGIGYAITGDSIQITLPEGVTNPYDDADEEPVKAEEPEVDPLALPDE